MKLLAVRRRYRAGTTRTNDVVGRWPRGRGREEQEGRR